MKMRCPECGSVDRFEIETIVTVTVNKDEKFTRPFDAEGGDIILNDNNNCRCLRCGKRNKVAKFREAAKEA